MLASTAESTFYLEDYDMLVSWSIVLRSVVECQMTRAIAA